MSRNKLRTALAAVLLAAALLAAGRARSEEQAAGLSPAEFQELKPLLDVKNQPWATIPWSYSITEARRRAAAGAKPIFMVVNTGNALGCT